MTPKVSTNPLWALPEDRARDFALEYLRAIGWRCEEPSSNGEEFTITEVAKILGQQPSTVAARLHHPDCPPAPRRLGPKGRLLAITMTPELEAWLDRPVRQGRHDAGDCAAV